MSTVVIGGSGSVDIYGKCRGGEKDLWKNIGKYFFINKKIPLSFYSKRILKQNIGNNLVSFYAF